MTKERSLAAHYDASFYEDQKGGSFSTAREVIPVLISLVQPRSVLDVGCGVGSWLAAFMEHKIDDVAGVDGDYVDRDQMMIPASRFMGVDLRSKIDLKRQFDLVMSLEVAEHLPTSCSESFVETLTTHGKVVLFSAAIPGQGGTNHINEQWPAYWQSLFEARGYVLVDCLRDRFWDNRKVGACYRQNMMLYVERSRLSADPELVREFERAKNLPLSVVHPEVFSAVLSRPPSLRELLRALPHALSESIRLRAKRIGKLIRLGAR